MGFDSLAHDWVIAKLHAYDVYHDSKRLVGNCLSNRTK